MIIIITGATHSGKNAFAQKLIVEDYEKNLNEITQQILFGIK